MISEWRSMWMIVMFDLPTKTGGDRRNYRLFRDFVLDEGFNMLQYSVYGRHCPSRELAASKEQRISRSLPPRGEVRVVTVTDAQFGRMRVYRESRRTPPEAGGAQLEFW